MALNIPGYIQSLFPQSKNTNEGVTERQKKTETITIPGTMMFPMYIDLGDEAYFQKDGGFYAALSNQDVIASVMLPEGATILSIQPVGTFAGTWYLYEGIDAPLTTLATGTQNQTKKINTVIDNKNNYYFTVALVAASKELIKQIIITYVE